MYIMSKCIAKTMQLKEPKRIVIWMDGVVSICLLIMSLCFVFVNCVEPLM